ncbi:MAG TPA: hypothetical protein VE988_23495 [Gemmataceae bacterium]|nr:hypothetical protein [Gemmataceae bacterium]
MHLAIGLVVLLGWVSGCKHTPSVIPSDPVLTSKTPLMSKPELKPPTIVAFHEPEAPPGPVALAPQLQGDAGIQLASHNNVEPSAD